MIFEAGLKAISKKAVQDEVSDTWTTFKKGCALPNAVQTGLSPAQQAELIRKDKGALRRAMSGFVAGL